MAILRKICANLRSAKSLNFLREITHFQPCSPFSHAIEGPAHPPNWHLRKKRRAAIPNPLWRLKDWLFAENKQITDVGKTRRGKRRDFFGALQRPVASNMLTIQFRMLRRTAAFALALSLLFLLPVPLASCPLAAAAPGDCFCRSMMAHSTSFAAPARTIAPNVGCLCPRTNSEPVQAAQNERTAPAALVPASVAFVSAVPATAFAFSFQGHPFEASPPFALQPLLCVFRI